jgi:hypothetical protein
VINFAATWIDDPGGLIAANQLPPNRGPGTWDSGIAGHDTMLEERSRLLMSLTQARRAQS